MNFLAHLYLSGNSDDLKFGNFIGDAVKGNKFMNFPASIQEGILLHRHIDTFTDANETCRLSIRKLRPKYGKYAGVVIDIFYDHFLSKNWEKYSNKNRHAFIRHSYVILVKNYKLLPAKSKKALPFIIARNWLGTYAKVSGIKSVLERMSKRTSLPDETDFAIKILEENYDLLNEEFNAFFVQIIDYVAKTYGIKYDH